MPGSAATRYPTPSRSSPRAITGIRCGLGLDAKIALGDRFSLNLDAAWLPYVKLNGTDSHWLRIGTSPGDFTGAVPDDGQGSGYQLEAAIAYAVNPNVSFAVGARYWRMEFEWPRPISTAMWSAYTALAAAGRLEGREYRRVRAGLVQIRPLSDRWHFLI